MSTKSGGDSDPIQEEYTGNVSEVGASAVWSLSSCKPGKLVFSQHLVFMLFDRVH